MKNVDQTPVTPRLTPRRLSRPHELSSSSSLHLVTPLELQNLRESLDRGRVPLDFQGKLASLAGTDLRHSFVQQNSQLFLAVLDAVRVGAFRGASRAELERLLRVLAYVRKDDDAIHDYLPNGYHDDHREVWLAAKDLQQMLNKFKCWRLRHEVPLLWLRLSVQPVLCED